MPDMPRPRKLHVHRETTRHGTVAWYFRSGKGPRVRLRGTYESKEWLADYEAALSGGPAPLPISATAGTLGWLIDRYLDSVAFTGLAGGTQTSRRNILKAVAKNGGDWRLEQVTTKKLAESRDKRSATPAAAHNFVRTMRAIFAWAVKAKHVASNPAADVETKAPKTDGHHTWTVDEVRKFWKRYPVGTMPRLAMDLMLFTGMRRSDAVLLGRQHVRDGWIRYRSQKTGVDVDLPVLAPLKRSMDAMPGTGMAFLVTEAGKPFSTSNSFGNWFADKCERAGVPGRAHGLRKAGATIAGENGATDLQLMAMWGWTDQKQAATYTRRANRAILAEQASRHLFLDEDGTSIPLPVDPVRGSERKAQ